MAREPAEVGELVAKIFDRLEREFPEGMVNDALLLLEISDPADMQELDDGTGREVPPTVVLLECTSDRVTIQSGILEFSRRTIVGSGDE